MKHLLKTPLGHFRLVSLAEGISFLLLLFVAMPIKYIGHEPGAVRVAGMAHGLLFVVFLITLMHAAIDRSWRLPRVLLALLASVLPFGAFVLERTLKREAAAEKPTAAS